MANDKATSPVPVTPLDGKTTADKMQFEPQRLSYTSAMEIATEVAKAISSKTEMLKKPIAIVDIRLLNDFANLQALYLELDRLAAAYKGLSDNARDLLQRRSKEVADLPGEEELAVTTALLAPIPILGAASALVAAGVGLASLFRQDVEYHGLDTVLEPLAFELAVASALLAAGIEKVWIADLMVLREVPKHARSLNSRLLELERSRAETWQAIAPLVSQLVQLDAELDKAAQDKDQKKLDALTAQVSELRRDLQPVSDPLARTDQASSDLQKQWNQIDQATGMNGLARLLRAENLRELKPLYLHCAIVCSGGHSRIIRNLWRTLFNGDGISFMGGAIARWGLFNEDGSITAGGIRIAQRRSEHL